MLPVTELAERLFYMTLCITGKLVSSQYSTDWIKLVLAPCLCVCLAPALFDCCCNVICVYAWDPTLWGVCVCVFMHVCVCGLLAP